MDFSFEDKIKVFKQCNKDADEFYSLSNCPEVDNMMIALTNVFEAAVEVYL